MKNSQTVVSSYPFSNGKVGALSRFTPDRSHSDIMRNVPLEGGLIEYYKKNKQFTISDTSNL
jgi:hypothetical protein